jgi:hypothetical protein
MKHFLVYIFIFFGSFLTFGQEIQCDVSVISPQLKSDPANVEIMKSLELSIVEFIGGQQWTDDTFLDEEKIDMIVLITINSKNGSNFNASIQVSSSRPVYNSDYRTRLFNFNDEKLTFDYERGQALIFSMDRQQSNLADVLAYYVYMVLGYDYDSFSLKGGTVFFNKAQQIVGRCQSVNAPGWKPTDGKKNRFTIVDNALNNAFENLRICYYDYHRKGFDQLYANSKQAVQVIAAALKSLEEIHKTQPNSVNVQNFFAAKADEVVALFKDMDPQVKNQVYMTVSRLDPGNIVRYNKMKE